MTKPSERIEQIEEDLAKKDSSLKMLERHALAGSVGAANQLENAYVAKAVKAIKIYLDEQTDVDAREDPVLMVPISKLEDELGASVVYTLLSASARHLGLELVGDLVRQSERDLMKVRGIGRKTVRRIQAFLGAHGLQLETEQLGWRERKAGALGRAAEAEAVREVEQPNLNCDDQSYRAVSDRHERMAKFMDEHGGIASVSELASLLELPESTVRRFARDRGVRRLGATFAFDVSRAVKLADEYADVPRAEDG